MMNVSRVENSSRFREVQRKVASRRAIRSASVIRGVLESVDCLIVGIVVGCEWC